MVRIKRKEVRLANRGALKKGFALARVRLKGVSPADEARAEPPPWADSSHGHHSDGSAAMGCHGVLSPPEVTALMTSCQGRTLAAAVP